MCVRETAKLRGIDDVRRWDTGEKSRGEKDEGSPEVGFRCVCMWVCVGGAVWNSSHELEQLTAG